MIQGMGGIMDITGHPDGEPTRTGVAYVDVFTGTYSVVGILSALRERDRTGHGCHIDMALLDTQVSVLANQALYYLVSGKPPQRLGNAHASIVPYQEFPVSDGHIIIACGNDGQFVKLSAILGAPELATDPRFRTNESRVNNRQMLVPIVYELTQKFARADLLAKLEAAGVPAGPINNLAQVFADPQVIARGMRIERESAAAKGGSIAGVRTPIMFGDVPSAADRPSPLLGEHTQEVLREIGEG
jgi:crotonobetainyl-CoA:carnitine CoA-transferase CaiB-like acyl-CoA transferase